MLYVHYISTKLGGGEILDLAKASTVQQFLFTFTFQSWITPPEGILPLKSVSIPGLTQSIIFLPDFPVVYLILLVSFSRSPSPTHVLSLCPQGRHTCFLTHNCVALKLI